MSATQARLGTNVAYSFTGTLTPNGNVYRLGGGTGVLTLPNANMLTDDGATPRSLNYGNPSGLPALKITAANSYTGGTTITGATIYQNEVEVSSPAALGTGTINLRGGSLYYNTGTASVTVPNNFDFSNSVAQPCLQFNQSITFTGTWTLPAGVDLMLNRNGSNAGYTVLPALDTQAGKLSNGRGTLVLSNVNQIPQGRIDLSADSGMTVFDNLSWGAIRRRTAQWLRRPRGPVEEHQHASRRPRHRSFCH